ncbi:hypothetical protein BDV97DRAFT_351849 [Delphinella strobiligena]|nr:hypothetical protein BDV97DRAFT_351849 [Delphinella strobiligena]
MIFGFTIQLAGERCWRDPSSVFFQAEESHEPVYSLSGVTRRSISFDRPQQNLSRRQ